MLKRERVKAEMEEARHRQFKEQDERLAEQAKAERDEFIKVIQKQKEDEEAEKKLAEERVEALRTHQKTIQSMIGKNDEVRKQDRLDYLEEGKKTRDKITAEREKIQQIKNAKLE